MSVAREYFEFDRRGDVVLRRQCARTIDDLVGRWIDASDGPGHTRRVWGWPACVVAAARGRAKQDLPGYVPASEVRS
jgi:hypothetical protein